MAVNAFDVLEVLEKSGILKTSSIDGKPFKIRVRYGSDVNQKTRKQNSSGQGLPADRKHVVLGFRAEVRLQCGRRLTKKRQFSAFDA
jgi:hypothetical protein